MNDLTFGSLRGRQLHVRVWTPWSYPYRTPILTALKDFFLSFTGWRFWHRLELELRNLWKYQSRCYCPTGYQTELSARVGQYWGLRIWFSRWTGAAEGPCPCEIGLHEYHKSIGEDCQCVVADMELDESSD